MFNYFDIYYRWITVVHNDGDCPIMKRGHPLERHGAIRRQLAGLICSGAKAPGMRLPTRLELADEFKTSPVTIQKALLQLANDGFVVARGRAGTFVTERPPHLYRFGLVIPNIDSVGFLRTLVEQAAVLEQTYGWRFPIYSGVDNPKESDNYQSMLEDLRSHRVAGLILTQQPGYYLDTPLFAQPDLPRVAIVNQHHVPDVGCVHLDNQMFIGKALDYLKARGRRRVAFVATPNISSEFIDCFTDGVASRQMTTGPAWIQALDHRSLHWAAHVVAALMAGPVSTRPDALIIADDHLVESVTTALRHLGVRVPAALEIVAHCNYPNLPLAVVPVGWLGYDVRRVLQNAVEYIQQNRSGPPPAPVINVPAQFDHELSEPGRLNLPTATRLAARGSY